MSSIPIPESFFLRPDLYFVEYRGNQTLFAHMTRDTYYYSLFTDRARIKAKTGTPVMLDMAALSNALDASKLTPKTIYFIFHTANCGSTLLSRALDIPGRTLGYREPYPLRQLGVESASLSAGCSTTADWKARLKLIMVLLGRRYSEAEIPIVKANIPVNFILPDVLDSIPDHRGILLFSSLEEFLVSALKSPQRRQWVMNVSNEVSGSLQSILDLPKSEIDGNSAPKKAASLWVAQIRLFHDAVSCYDGLKSLSSDQFFEDPMQTIARASEHYGLELTSEEINNIVDSELFRRYSKNPNIEYDVQARKSELRKMTKDLESEISEGMQWGDALLDRQHISANLADRLF